MPPLEVGTSSGDLPSKGITDDRVERVAIQTCVLIGPAPWVSQFDFKEVRSRTCPKTAPTHSGCNGRSRTPTCIAWVPLRAYATRSFGALSSLRATLSLSVGRYICKSLLL